MKISFPGIIRILAMEITPPYEIKEGLSEPIKESFPEFLHKCRSVLSGLITSNSD